MPKIELHMFEAMGGKSTIEIAAEKIGATPADIPGLWNAPGYPELTTAQLLDVAFGKETGDGQ